MLNVKLKGEGERELVLSVDEDVLDDMELLEDLADLDEQKAQALPRVIKRVLGEEQKAALYEFLRGGNGRVKTSAVSAALKDIFGQIKDGKKS